MKAEEEVKRARSRKENLERALEHERLGNHAAAYECYRKAVDITPAIAFRLIKVLRKENVEYIVAPYEADAQMAFLALHGHVDLVITEDSDLIPYGCPQVFFKMDKFGQGVDFQYSNLVRNRELDLNNFTKQMVLEMCIMSGCDYLPSLPGMGLKRAHGVIKRFKSYRKVIKHLKFSGVMIDQHYEGAFERAILTFQHQRVYDPSRNNIVHLTDAPSDLGTDLDFLGPNLSQTLAIAIARGEVDPTSKMPFEDEVSGYKLKSQTSLKLNTAPPKKHLELLVQKNVLTNYFMTPSVAARKQFKAPQIAPKISMKTASMNQDDCCQATPISESLSPFSHFSLTPEDPKVFGAKRSSSLSDADFHVDMLEPNLLELTSDFERPMKKANRIAGEEIKEQNFDSDDDELMKTAANLGVKRKPFVSPVLLKVPFHDTAGVKGRMLATHKTLAVKRSDYFSHSTPLPLDLTHQDEATGQRVGVSGFGDCAVDSEVQLPAVENAVELSERPARKADQSVDAIAAGKRKHMPSFRSTLLKDGAVQGGSFSSVSHVGHYAGLAQKSMDRFVSAITPFRSTSGGARASGLRPPSTTRACLGKTCTNSDGFGQFAHTAGFKVSRPALSQPRPIPAGTVRWQNQDPTNWE
ncbi:hypothetical protein BDL97_01G134100 [Sphagnum fallax]|nr:hypothetical protein BDL97_01G134100 [Sphagnum fallax]